MDIRNLLSSLLPETKKRLLNSPHVCLAVFQSLGEKERLAVLRLLCGPVPRAIIEPAGQESAIPSLLNMGLIDVKRGIASLEKAFQANLTKSLSAPTSTESHDEHGMIDANQLVLYAKQRWEALIMPLLKRVIGDISKGSSVESISEIPNLYQNAKLMEGDTVTADGVRFLLLDIPSQVWRLLLAHIESHIEPTKKVIALSMLIRLTTLVVGKVYPLDTLSEFEQTLIEDWLPFGILRKIDNKHYTVTPLARQIISSTNTPTTAMGNWYGGIIVESNFYLYAYTDSTVMIGVLGLFSRLITRLPNMCVAHITRKSIRHALKLGLTAEEILAYLQRNIHPVHLEKPKLAPEKEFLMLLGDDDLASGSTRSSTLTDDEALLLTDPDQGHTGLPPSVSEQLLLWQEERARIQPTFGSMWDDFPDQETFDKVLKYAEDLDAVVWKSVTQRSMFIKSSANDVVKKYFQSIKAKQ